ncbi:MAG: pyridoxal phosphate-dependent aminotransferase [Lachnospiraceae bacterium]|nr:pyridoxal phosphate-dependent aminotransferase [Lachnospiraceae bacterium]
MAERYLDFDEIIDRHNTNSVKYDLKEDMGYPEDALSLWVADMDFKSSSYIEDALERCIKHGVYGYGFASESYVNAVLAWMRKHHNWIAKSEWLVKAPGVVFAIAAAIRAYTNPGDAVLIQEPVYYPFKNEIVANKRKTVINNLLYENGKYSIDFEDFEKKIVNENVKLFILCSPHNPVGRVWKKDELERLGNICKKHEVIIVSDEIHHDLIFRGEHIVFTNVNKDFEDFTIICTAPSKTFNLAGLCASNIFIPNQKLRNKYKEEMSKVSANVNILGLAACEAAYSKGETWYNAMMKYVKENIDFTKEFVKNIPGVKMVETEGTYLIWLDFKELGLKKAELENLIKNKAKLWLDGGGMFGEAGIGFQRINAACPRSILEEALKRLKLAVEDIKKTA